MWTEIKNIYKTILTAIGLLLVGIMFAFLCENYYRQLVRFSFKFFNGDNIQFVGKNFHLFASDIFVASFGLFTSLTFLLLKFSLRPYRVKRVCLTIFVFFTTTIIITALDSKRLIIECTDCDEGIRRLTFNQLNYDKYFIISLIITFAYLLSTYLLDRKRLRKMNETI
jgi:hypothetical protein